jgi:hypothetical protein
VPEDKEIAKTHKNWIEITFTDGYEYIVCSDCGIIASSNGTHCLICYCAIYKNNYISQLYNDGSRGSLTCDEVKYKINLYILESIL